MAIKSGYSAILSSRAQKEIEISWEWYEERLHGLGDRFVRDVIARIRDIEKNPDRYPTRFKSYKEVSIDTFPFLIIYRISTKKKSIRIVSIFHTSQSPRHKYK